MYESVHLLVACLLLWSSPLRTTDAVNAVEVESARVDSYAAAHPSAVEGRIRRSFTAFAGSPENADALTRGLHDGSVIKLIGRAPDGVPTTLGFTPAAGPMSYGNVRISLALAQDQLAALGVTEPTPDQLEAVLNGGEISIPAAHGPVTATLTGVLELRAAGESWREIIRRSGTRLGPVISGLKTTYGGSVATVGGAPTGGTVGHLDKPADAADPNTTPVESASRSTGAITAHAYRKALTTTNGHAAKTVASSKPRAPGISDGADAEVALPIKAAVAIGGHAAPVAPTEQEVGNAHRQAVSEAPN